MFRRRDGTVGLKNRGAMFGRKGVLVNYLINGGFETGDWTAWTLTHFQTKYIESNSNPEGTYFARVHFNAQGTAILEQIVYDVPANSKLSFWIKKVNMYTCYWRVYDSSGWHGAEVDMENEWTHYIVDAQNTVSGYAKVWFRFYAGAPKPLPADMFFDGIRLY